MIKYYFLLLLTISTLFSASLNKLSNSESPYLLQHSTNPVNWFPYDKEAFKKARDEDKLIFLSIGYSTCHWCHVMEEESFTDENISKLLNDNYISIKVDKEEMPDVDVFYQDVYAIFHNGKNGWPLTIILTPKKEVMFTAMYVPDEDNYGMDGLKTLLPKMKSLYMDKKKLKILLDENKKVMQTNSKQKDIKVDGNLTTAFVTHMAKRYDKSFKGFDKRPRFPMASHLNILLNIYLLNGDKKAYTMVEETLKAMATGGIYDQIEGAFFRYTTYQDWIIPHYEKMLYTNAELIPIYVKMFLLTGENIYKKVVDETIHEFMQKFQNNHLFYAASDADSEHGEGRYFLYTKDEVEEVLKKASYTKDEIDQTLEYFDIADIGNVRDEYNNVHFHTDFEKPVAKVEQTKKLLLEIRKKRVFPYIDKKIITAWNAMMIKALFIASKVDERYKLTAQESMDTLLDKLYIDGVLYHQYLEGKKPTKIALLEDYAFVIDALLTGYQTTFDKHYLKLATKLTYESIKKFHTNNTWHLNQTGEKIASKYNDKYYTTPLSRHFNNILTVANLNYDLKLLKQAKEFIKQERQNILNNMGKSPEAMWALIRLDYEDIVLKTKKTNFATFHKQIDKIKYPFLLKKEEKTEMFLLCNESSCFFYDKNISKVIDKIDKKR